MLNKKSLSFSLLLLLVGATQVFAGKDFMLTPFPDYGNTRGGILVELTPGKTYFDFIQSEVADKLKKSTRQDGDDGELLKQGYGLAYKLNENNWNAHVNYFDSPQSGRSFGWTRGQVGDWSDRTILNNMSEVAKGSDAEIAAFYKTTVLLVGASDASTLTSLKGMAERVAVNFLAIYGAEAYRATLGTKNWDDALYETVLLGAFHAGQKKVAKFYMGKFQDFSFEQAPGVYNSRGAAPKAGTTKKKSADLTDYWQYTANPAKRVSGINETRPDFEKMGTVITTFEAKNSDLQAIEAIVKGKGTNVIKDLTQYFAGGKAKASEAKSLADHVAKLMVVVRKDADKISATAK